MATILSEYKADKAAADQKYKGQVILITGRASTIENESIKLRDANSSDGLECHLDSAGQRDVKNLALGQQVTIRGRIRGEGSDDVDECVISDAGNAAPPKGPGAQLSGDVVAADTILKDYGRSAGAADQKYKGKTVLVRGRVSLMSESTGSASLVLRGADDSDYVLCYFEGENLADLTLARVSQEVTVKGKIRGGSSVIADGCTLD